MSDYTPTWFEIRERLEHDTWLTADEADAWLAEHDAKVRAETLRNFADSIPGDIDDPRDVADLARGVADHIEKSESEAREVFEDWLAEQADREPSDAEVEAAAKTLAQWDGANWDAEEWDGEIPQESYRRGARAALIAAQAVRRA